MEKRKIQRTGGSSFSITLPKKWVDLNNIKKQDAVVLSSLQEGALIIRTAASLEKQTKKKLIVAGLNKEWIKREIIALYILGVEEIEVSAKALSSKQRSTVREVMRLLIGFEIIEESENTIYIKNILSSRRFSFAQSIEKMLAMTQSMFQDATHAMLENKKDLGRDVMQRDIEVDKLYFLILRYNNALIQGKASEEELNLTLHQSHYYENIATQLERMADHAVKIARVTQISGMSIKKREAKGLLFQNITSSLLLFLQDIKHLVNSELSKPQIHKVMDKVLNLEKDIRLFQIEASKSDFSEMLIVSDSLSRIQGYFQNIVEMSIDQSLAS